MRALFLKLEPIIWLLFGQGILIGTILLTGWVLIVGLAHPLGIFLQTLLIGLQRRFQAHLRFPRLGSGGLCFPHPRIGIAQFGFRLRQCIGGFLPCRFGFDQ